MSDKSLNKFINLARWMWDNRDKISSKKPPTQPPFFSPEDNKKFEENWNWLNKEMEQPENAQIFAKFLALQQTLKYISTDERIIATKYQKALKDKPGKVSIDDLK